MSENPKPPNRQAVLAETRSRLNQLEAETQRLRTQLARLEADGLDDTDERDAAEQLERQIAELDQKQTKLRQSEPPTRKAAEKPTPDKGGEELAVADDYRAGGFFAGENFGDAAAEPIAVSAAPVIDSSEAEEGGRKRTLAAQLRDAPAWATSLGVHAVILVLFSLLTIVSLPEVPPPMLSGAPDGDEYLDEFSEVDFSPMELDPTELSEMDLEISPTESTTLDQSELESPWEEAAVGLSDLSPGVSAALPTDAASLMLGDGGGDPSAGGGRGDRPDGGGKKSGARFFGAKSKGNRFVFVVDNSGSMTEGRMETTLMEIQRAVFAMNAEQRFYVLFYSDQAYPLFFPNSVDDMVPATRENKQRLADWLPTVEICVGGRLDLAMKVVDGLAPSAVYLMSDGDIRSDYIIRSLTDPGERDYTIHTFGMTVKKPEYAELLFAIARANGGSFTPVGITPAAAQLSRRRQIPYHNKGPGPVWGARVRPRD